MGRGKGKLQTPGTQHAPEAGRTSVTAMMGTEGVHWKSHLSQSGKSWGFRL